MEKENKSFVFYSSYFEAVKPLDADTRLEIYEAIMNFALEDKEPTLTGFANIVFALIRPTLSASMTRHQNCVENGKKGKEYGHLGGQFGCLGGAPLGNQNARKNKKTTPQNNPPNTLKTTPLNYNDNYNENYNFNENCNYNEKENEDYNGGIEEISLTKKIPSLTEIQNFQDAFPNRKLDLDKLPAVPPNFDMTKLIQHIKQSTFLTSAHNMGLASCLKNYDAIINGNYADFAKPQPQAHTHKESWERQYSFADLDALFDNPEDIEV